jgi:alkaline phosphatase D
MSSLREAGLGPIVGHTTARSGRVWIRAREAQDEMGGLAAQQRTIGVGAVVGKNDQPIDPDEIQAFYFRRHREHDRSGIFDAGAHTCITKVERDGELVYKPSSPLQPGTSYTVRLGTLTIDDPFGDDENISSDVLAERLPNPNVWVGDLLNLRQSSPDF